jgi:two-component system sensor histidine kinase KdpD
MTASDAGGDAVRRASVRVLVLGLLALAAGTVAMLSIRDHLDKAHIALLLLLIPLGGSAAGGRSVGLALAGASFLVFNWFFLPPYHTFVVADPRDWLILIAFLVTSAVAAQLLYNAQEQARVAQRRTEEVDRLRVVGAEALNAGRAEDALNTIAAMIREAAQADSCELLSFRDERALRTVAAVGVEPDTSATEELETARDVAGANVAAVEWPVVAGRLRGARPEPDELAILRSGMAQGLLLPLSVRERVVGVLRLRSVRGLRLDAEHWRFVDALSYYAALGIERVRLIAAVERAEALREADELKDALLASVSHDLRTPLTTIKARAHEMRVHGDEQAEVIEQEADRLNRIVVDLLDLSRLKAGVLPTTLELNAVDEIVELVVQRVEGVFGQRTLAVQLSPDGDLLFGRCDLAHSVRILVNLVENADKYAPVGTPIELSARRNGKWIEVSVADRGPGLPSEETERAFEPFNRSPDLPPDVGGSGLGLAIARRLAEAQSASLRYAPREGGGSVFTYSFPAIDLTTDAAAGVRG